MGKLLTIRDITEKKMTEEKLWQQQQEIAIKVERERMARDLHDNLGQVCGFVNVQTQAIREYLKQEQLQTADRCLERITEVVQEAHKTVRETILTMRGEKPLRKKKTCDLFRELEKQVAAFWQSYGIKVEMVYLGEASVELNSGATEQVLNIIKESLNNISKHARASAVKIRVEEKDNGLNISISDNGCGFDIEKSIDNSSGQYGLLIMKERTAAIGGNLELYSEIGRGTTVKLIIPNS